MEWYYAIEGQQHGPVDEATVAGLVESGDLKPADVVWNESMGDAWSPVSRIESLAGLTPAAAGMAVAPGRVVSQAARVHNRELITQARAALQGNWAIAVGAYLIYQCIFFVMGFIPGVGSFGCYILSGPFAVGLAIFTLTIARRGEPSIGQLFEGFKSFLTALCAYLLMLLFIMLWSLLFLIPGILASYSYSMTFFIIADNPAIGAREAIDKSKAMMLGNRWKFFCLGCRFIGWMLLCLLTLGIGFLWLMPWMQVAMARFYEDVSGNSLEASPSYQ